MKVHWNRREWLGVGSLSLLSTWAARNGLGAHTTFTANGLGQAERTAVKRAILVWLDGGPTHLEMWDPKPEAPSEIRGPFGPVATNVNGIHVGEHLSRVAQQMDRWCLLRSLTSPLGEHNFGTHYLMTGYRPTPALEYPALGSVASHLRAQGDLPGHVAVPNFRVGGSRFSGRGYLPVSAAPFAIGGDPARPDFRVEDLTVGQVATLRRLERRQRYLEAIGESDSALDQAFRLVLSEEVRNAFDLAQEPADVRARYGPRTVGQSCLLARRLIERGVSFVTVNDPGWDTHDQAVTRLRDGYTGAQVPVGKIPSLDLALSALVDDLIERDLWESTLVIVMGEFGRTPKLNTSGGRDHWPRCFSAALSGAGVRGGQVIGTSDARGESPRDQPITPADLAFSIFQTLGIDPTQSLRTDDGRPIAISREGRWIEGLT
ncbi:MAG: DUF1501 domain-containing protein [Planctomycetales bacterium]|nr:DUF1501 domain-containing protein [Planctomycetales bacterium]